MPLFPRAHGARCRTLDAKSWNWLVGLELINLLSPRLLPIPHLSSRIVWKRSLEASLPAFVTARPVDPTCCPAKETQSEFRSDPFSSKGSSTPHTTEPGDRLK